jgi:uncharacterized protein YciI
MLNVNHHKVKRKMHRNKRVMFTIMVLIGVIGANAQNGFPGFLHGTWKMEHQEICERWDSLNPGTLKGFSYLLENGQINIIEYLEIARHDHGVQYKATVMGQNGGADIVFALTDTAGSYTFENQLHDFPRKIVYHQITDTTIFVEVSDGQETGFSYTMIKQIARSAPKDTTIANPDYQPELARKLGADDYGMKNYMLVVLKTGSNTTSDKTFINQCFRGHLDNITQLVKGGKMVLAGPLGKNEEGYRGIFILNVASADEAALILQTDPAIKEGLLDFELYPWYGSAALPTYLEASEKIWKRKP